MALTEKEQKAIQSLLVDMVAVVPPLNIAMGIKDITSVGWDLYRKNYKNKEEENALKVELILGTICLIPGAGAPVRTTFKQLIRNPDVYAPLMFEIITLIIEKANVQLKKNGIQPIAFNPEALLNQMVDTGRLKSYLEQGRQAALKSAKDSVFGRWFDVSGTINTCFDFLEGNLISCIQLLRPHVLGAITKSKARVNNSAMHRIPDKNTPKTQQNTPKAQEKSGQDRPTKTVSAGKMKERIQTAYPKLANSFGGGVGEHIADYYCLEQLGWGKGNWIRHDEHNNGKWKAGADARKLNDRGKLKKLQPIGNDAGIDGFWKANPATNGGKPYAVVEAKASMSHMGQQSNLAKMMGVLAAKENGKHVVQMDHAWITQRLEKLMGEMPAGIKADFGKKTKNWKTLYRRHVIFTTLQVPETDGWKHAEALLDGHSESKHRSHQPTKHINNEREIYALIRTARNNAEAEERRHKAKGKTK